MINCGHPRPEALRADRAGGARHIGAGNVAVTVDLVSMGLQTARSSTAATPVRRAIWTRPRGLRRRLLESGIEVLGHTHTSAHSRALRKHASQCSFEDRRRAKKIEPRARLLAWVWHAVKVRTGLARPTEISTQRSGRHGIRLTSQGPQKLGTSSERGRSGPKTALQEQEISGKLLQVLQHRSIGAMPSRPVSTSPRNLTQDAEAGSM